MPATFTHQQTLQTVTPDLLQTRELRRESRTTVLPLQGQADSLVISRPPGLRTGTHVLFFTSQAAATTALGVLATPGTLNLTVTAPESTAWAMRLAIVGELQLSQEGAGLNRWLISAEFLELTP